jgi:hypothetical protein
MKLIFLLTEQDPTLNSFKLFFNLFRRSNLLLRGKRDHFPSLNAIKLISSLFDRSNKQIK